MLCCVVLCCVVLCCVVLCCVEKVDELEALSTKLGILLISRHKCKEMGLGQRGRGRMGGVGGGAGGEDPVAMRP